MLKYAVDEKNITININSCFYQACEQGNLEIIKFLFSKAKKINYKTCVKYICGRKNIHLFKFILDENTGKYYKLNDKVSMLIDAICNKTQDFVGIDFLLNNYHEHIYAEKLLKIFSTVCKDKDKDKDKDKVKIIQFILNYKFAQTRRITNQLYNIIVDIFKYFDTNHLTLEAKEIIIKYTLDNYRDNENTKLMFVKSCEKGNVDTVQIFVENERNCINYGLEIACAEIYRPNFDLIHFILSLSRDNPNHPVEWGNIFFKVHSLLVFKFLIRYYIENDKIQYIDFDKIKN